MSEFVEIRGELDVDDAIARALAELGLESADDAEIEVVTAGRKPTILGRFGGAETLVRARPKPPQSQDAQKKRRRRRRGKGGGGDGGERQEGRSQPPQQQAQPRKQSSKPKQPAQPAKAPQSDAQDGDDDLAGQAERVESFLGGLVSAFGIEGTVKVTTEDDIILASVDGEQAETLVGQKGAVMAAVQEVTRTVVQRRFHRPGRVRVDVAGYRERRRQALAIYAERLATQVLEDGGEIMLEPMNAADRKVVHDTVGGIDGVESYSEGEDPRRSVVISKIARDEEE